MERSIVFLTLCCFLLVLYGSTQVAAVCNEAVCASLVSKCLLLKSCECDMTDKANCTCCKSCHKCLAKLYVECCSCVGMCPDRALDSGLVGTSSVGEIDDPIPELFTVLTEEEDPYMRWTTHHYPAHLDLLYFKPRGHADHISFATNEDDDSALHHIRHGGHRVLVDPGTAAMNCTVAYMSQCLPLSRCQASCASMGAARYRWFHQHGCCECIANTCLDFGKSEALCHSCPRQEGQDEEEDEFYDVEIEPDDTQQLQDEDEEAEFEDEENDEFDDEMDEEEAEMSLRDDEVSINNDENDDLVRNMAHIEV